MGKYVRLGLGIIAGAAAGLAIYSIIRGCRCEEEARPPFAESAEYGEEQR